MDGSVKLYDTDTFQEFLSLRGHADLVWSVAFSPDGRRIASASNDRTVKIWDSATGQEVLTLRGHTGDVRSVAFSPDGRTLASAGRDRLVKIWDSTPPSPEMRILNEARSVVEFLFGQSLPMAAVVARIRNDPTLSDLTRERALDLAEEYGKNLVVHEAESFVEGKFARGWFRAEVLESVRTDSGLSEPVRKRALVLAEQIPENAVLLDQASSSVVSLPGAEVGAYRLALHQAEAACRVIPDHGGFLTTLGLAQYRVGDYAAALATLTRADQINAPAVGGSTSPIDLAFLALAQHRVGQADQARSTLGRLRETMEKEPWIEDKLAQAWLREAEAIELDRVFPADPLAGRTMKAPND
jgi:hypothetical protein